ncbi:MAG: peroxiredoxin [Myxococcota bacterium]
MASSVPGSAAPDVRLSDGAHTLWLADLLGKKTVVLYFYPKDDTPGCTVEACGFRDAYEDFVRAGAEVIGVSRDSAEAHARFKAKHNLPFTLLSDPDGKAAEAFGVKKTFGVLPGRSTFVIDRAGVIRLRFDSQLRASEHVRRALDLVRELEVK